MKTIRDYNNEIYLKNRKLDDILNSATPILMIGILLYIYIMLMCNLINLFVLVVPFVLFCTSALASIFLPEKMKKPEIERIILSQCSKFTDIALDRINMDKYCDVTSVDIMINNKYIKIHSKDIISVDTEKRPMKSFVYVQKYEGKDYIAYFVAGHDFYKLKDKVERDIYNPDI